MSSARMGMWMMAVATAGCAGGVLEVGSRGGNGAASGASSGSSSGGPLTGGPIAGAKACAIPATADAGNPSSTGDAGVDLSALVGTWNGYVEAYTFPSGSDAVVLGFAAQSDGAIQGTITFGVGPPLPPVTGDEGTDLTCGGATAVGPAEIDAGIDAGKAADRLQPGSLAEGFAYTAARVSFADARLRFTAILAEPWKAWCPLQTAYDWSAEGLAGQCGCAPAIGNQRCQDGVYQQKLSDTGEWVSLSGGWLDLCHGARVCSCTEAGCSFDTQSGGPTLDVHFTPGNLDGVVTGVLGGMPNIHLTLAP